MKQEHGQNNSDDAVQRKRDISNTVHTGDSNSSWSWTSQASIPDSSLHQTTHDNPFASSIAQAPEIDAKEKESFSYIHDARGRSTLQLVADTSLLAFLPISTGVILYRYISSVAEGLLKPTATLEVGAVVLVPVFCLCFIASAQLFAASCTPLIARGLSRILGDRPDK